MQNEGWELLKLRNILVAYHGNSGTSSVFLKINPLGSEFQAVQCSFTSTGIVARKKQAVLLDYRFLNPVLLHAGVRDRKETYFIKVGVGEQEGW